MRRGRGLVGSGVSFLPARNSNSASLRAARAVGMESVKFAFDTDCSGAWGTWAWAPQCGQFMRYPAAAESITSLPSQLSQRNRISKSSAPQALTDLWQAGHSTGESNRSRSTSTGERHSGHLNRMFDMLFLSQLCTKRYNILTTGINTVYIWCRRAANIGVDQL